MFRRIEDFLASWRYEADKTLAVMEAIPEANLGQQVAEGHRDLRRLAWHLVESLVEMPGHMGVVLPGAERLQGPFIGPPPATGAEIRQAYTAASEALLAALQGWKDADLDVEDDLYGDRWPRGKTLGALISHQIHHRGQMTVLLRQAGQRVPDVYGPAKEGWPAYGMQPPAV